MPKQFLTLIAPTGAVTTQLMSPAFVSTDANGFSDLMYMGGNSVVAIWVPGSNSGAAWVTANIAVYAALANGSQTSAANYAPLYKPNGTQYVIDVPSVPATGLFVQVDPYDFVGLDGVQFQSVNTSSSSTPVVQTNSPTITVVTIGNGSF